MLSSPVNGQVYDDNFVTNNDIYSNPADNNQKAIASYTTLTNAWSFMTAGNPGTFTSGKGYSVKRKTSAGDIPFTGAINNGNVSILLDKATDGFNLLGNPYTSHLDIARFITDNTANLVSETLWLWNQNLGAYETYPAKVGLSTLAPGQGFFVKAKNNVNAIFNKINQETSGGNFQKTSNTLVKLTMNDGSQERFAKVYYLENVTKGFDNGYDGEAFGGIPNSVDVFTHLLENNEGKKYQVQSLPIAEMETMIVPLGVKEVAGKEVTFTVEASNLPTDVKVFLEDRVANTLTRLDEANTSYKVTLDTTLDGTGRFFLHTQTSSVLSTDEVVLQNTSIYAINNNKLRVVGLPTGKANLKIFNILGKQVMQTSFSATGVKEITMPKMSTGMYIIQLETSAGKISKKIVLE